jgi:phospholipid/cholesterol/gamma-HCH transport system permease protein
MDSSFPATTTTAELPVHVNAARVVARPALTALEHAGRFGMMLLELIRALPEWRAWLPRAFEQCQQVGYGSLFIVMLTAAFAGGVAAYQAGYQFTGNMPVYIVGAVISESVILELGPVMTALLLAGRVGARYAAELGTMRVTEQLDALESLGRNPASHLLLPRVLAGLLMMPALVVVADATGMAAGWLAAKGSLHITNSDFVYGTQRFFRTFDLWYSVIKAEAFGAVVTIIPCYVGFEAKEGAEGVGRATTSAVVASCVLILLLDLLLAKLLL